MAWTKEQQQAIDCEGTNILVSAGAGSGKTAVLTERVKRKVLGGTSVSRLLVLTFTNAAAAEMKERIRKALQNTPGLEKEVSKVDSSYITTFDSFALSIVKKYHTRLNIPEDIGITDEVFIKLKKQEILEEIFDCHYEKPSKEFLQLIEDFCLKDDKELKEDILGVYSKIELKYDKTEFIKNYIATLTKEQNQKYLDQYLEFLREKQTTVKQLFSELPRYFEEDFVEEMKENFDKFLNAKTYRDFFHSMDYRTVRVPRGSTEEGKAIKGQIVDLIGEFKENYLNYDSEEEILKGLESTKNHQMVIFEILEQFDSILEHYKQKNHIYNFQDIARMAIQVVEENPDIQEELTNSFDEILVDEYQDTSDIQEKFISLISNHNVYMVGDIKQSIYRFRNANPDIFKTKYRDYQEEKDGIKIDLLKNFRSRREVLDDINLIFNPIMDEKIGGAAYPESHQMVFGNTSYEEEGKTEQNYHMRVLTYNPKELKNVSKSEEEAFIVGNDILEKLKNHFQIFDKDSKMLREATYKDFVILLDRSTQFDTYKKVFEYLQIPLQILQDESFQEEDDSFIFKNLLTFILCIKKEDFTRDFFYSFVSLSRSYLYQLSDSEIYERFLKKEYEDTKLYQDAFLLSQMIDSMSLSEFIREVFKKISYEESILKTSRIHAKRVREEYFYNLSKSFEKLGNTIYDFVDYLDKIFESEFDLTFNGSEKSTNSARIMTIHKSKGLEFPICYFAGLSSGFNLMELNERILFDKEYGLILPVVDHSYKDTILKTLLKTRVRLEEISEKIRLFYVATTRAKEEMIFITPELEEEYSDDKVPDFIRMQYRSFYSLLKSITSILLPFVKAKDVEVTKDYLKTSKISTLTLPKKEKYTVQDLMLESKEIEEAHFSKSVHSIPTEEEKEVMAFGTEVHEILEELDFANPDLLDLVENKFIQKKIREFLQSDLMKCKLNDPMYKEYEFYTMEDGIMNHGIIDLLIDNGDSYTIIDYKLKNIDDDAYIKQLNGYRSYMEQLTGKRVDCYLYSILRGEYKEV